MKKRHLLSLLLACFLLAGLIPVTPAAATAEAIDVVVVLDRSSAMDETILACAKSHTHLSGCYESRMTAAKRTAKALITQILDRNSNARVALVTFAKEAAVSHAFTAVKTVLRSSVNVTTCSHKAANLEAGLVAASNCLQQTGRAGARQAIVLVTAGEPKYYNDKNDEVSLGSGLVTTTTCIEQTLDQAHLSRDFGAGIYAVSVGAASGSSAEHLLLAAQDQGYYTADANPAAAIAADLAAGDDPFDCAVGTGWTVGFAKESLLPANVPFMSYKPEDLPSSGLLYDRSIFSDDLSFDASGLPESLQILNAKLNTMTAAPNRYPSSMVQSLRSFVDRVLPIDPPFSPERLLANSATFTEDLAAFEAQFGAAETALANGEAVVLADAAARYETAGMTAAEAEAAAAQNLAAYFATGASDDAQLDADYRALAAEVGDMELTDYTPEATRYYMAGYEIDLPCLGYLDEPHIRAVCLDDHTGRGAILMVSVESIGMARADVNRIRDALAPFVYEHGIREVHVLSAHNHASIDTMGIWGPIYADGKDDAYFAMVLERIESAAVAAFNAQKPGTLHVGTADAAEQTGYPEPLVEDRRYPYVTENASLITRFRFAPSDGSKELYLIHFGTHLEALQDMNQYISADFLDPFQDYLDAQNDDADFIFFTGAIGGQIRTKRNQTLPEGYEPRNTRQNYWKITQITGQRTGELVCGITAADEIELSAKLNTVSTSFEAKIDNYVLALLAQLKIINTRTYLKDLNTGLRGTLAGVSDLQTLGTAAANALTTFLRLKGDGGVSDKDLAVRTMLAFGRTYYQVLSDNLGNYASTEMHYFEFYQKNGARVKGLVLMPGEIFPELVYGGLLEGGTGDYYLDPHNPDAEPIDLLAEIAEATGRDYGDRFVDLLVFGQANDMMGYIVAPNDFLLNPNLPYIEQYPQGSWRHHYEETNSCGPQTAYTVAEAFRGLMAKAR